MLWRVVAATFTLVVLSSALPHAPDVAGINKFGIGLVNEGSTTLFDEAHDLVGDGGIVLLIFAGMDKTRTGPDQSWIAGVNDAAARNLRIVLRLSPGWGSAHFRDESDDSGHLNYTTLASAYAATVNGLPKTSGNIYIQVHNEPDLCYEWFCGTAASQPEPYQQVAAEYAHFLAQTADAIHALGNPRLQVGAAGLAPGGCTQCGCCGQQNCPGDKPGITGLQFMQAMEQAVPGVWSKMDFLATHSYPASGVGFGFNVPFNQSLTGLKYYELELQTINRSLPVMVTETGWASHRQGLPTCTEDQKAEWYTDAYNQVWLTDDRVVGVMPFMLQDSQWGDTDGYAFVLTNGQRQPCFTSVKGLRCSLGIGGGCP